MAEISNCNPLASWGYTPEVPLETIISRLFALLNGGGLVKDAVSDVKHNSTNNTLEITYSDKPAKTIILIDKFLSTVSYNKDTDIITFTLSDLKTIDLDLSSLTGKFHDKDYINLNYYDKKTVDDKINNSGLVWHNF